jgi:hypothetical protein
MGGSIVLKCYYDKNAFTGPVPLGIGTDAEESRSNVRATMILPVPRSLAAYKVIGRIW